MSAVEDAEIPKNVESLQTPDVANGDLSDQEQRNDRPAERPARSSRKSGGLRQELRERVKEKYQPKALNALIQYNKLGSQFAEFANNVAFLSRCSSMRVVPKSHRIHSDKVKNTRVVVRILDQCSFKIMSADLDYCRQRKHQVRRNRNYFENRLKEMMSPEDFEEVRKVCDDNKELKFTEVKEKQRKEFEDLLEEYKLNETRRSAVSRRELPNRDRRFPSNVRSASANHDDNEDSAEPCQPQQTQSQAPSKDATQSSNSANVDEAKGATGDQQSNDSKVSEKDASNKPKKSQTAK